MRMDSFKDKVAIVTGGASGIGRALCEELGRRGAAVVVADVRGDEAGAVAAGITAKGGRAHAVQVDVSKEGEVRALVEETVRQHGRLDYVFNNAGIAVVGEVRDMGLEHWRRILDVNLWGVIHGTMAAYPAMVRQGFGHIVNTASAAGLVPVPMLTAYAATKHAVVGLSLSLRGEAAALGVKVSVVCPGQIRTDIPRTTEYVGVRREDIMARIRSEKMMDPAKCAQVILRGVARNKAIITVTGLARVLWWLYRLHPSLPGLLLRRGVRDFRAMRREE